MEKCECCSGKATLEEVRNRILTAIGQYGWSVVAVGGEGEEPGYGYSIGLWHTFRHPEVIVFGLPPEIAQKIINNIGRAIKKGSRFSDNATSDIIANHRLAFADVPEDCYEFFVGMGISFYEGEHFPLLQVVWPDPQGKFPWDEGFDKKFNKIQPLLKNSQSRRFDANNGSEQGKSYARTERNNHQ